MRQVDRRHKAQKTVPSIVAAVALVAVVAGCESVGPDKLVGTHQGYNDAVQLAESREMLLNIVRLRFGDPMTCPRAFASRRTKRSSIFGRS